MSLRPGRRENRGGGTSREVPRPVLRVPLVGSGTSGPRESGARRPSRGVDTGRGAGGTEWEEVGSGVTVHRVDGHGVDRGTYPGRVGLT